ncbi:hypothetical protein [Frigidibacter sp. MR17.24]|uniref:hypothetical protein n=1 Tax=Frigidibacter sp. MR17.24 TaxID=3127345 RepID=UPI003012AC83
MSYDWMIDVLRDLSQFADANDMPRLVAQLEAARAEAEAEIARKSAAESPAEPFGDSLDRRA